MGTSQSHPILLALNELLGSKNLKIKQSTLRRFLSEFNTITPWFAEAGSLSISSWEKLGRDLDFAFEQRTLKGGVRPVWKMVRNCLEDQCCNDAIKNGQTTLEIIQEERSEKSEKTGSEKKTTKARKIIPRTF